MYIENCWIRSGVMEIGV